MATLITKTEIERLSVEIDGAGYRVEREYHTIIVDYDRFLADSGRVYSYEGNLEADIVAAFGSSVTINVNAYDATKPARQTEIGTVKVDFVSNAELLSSLGATRLAR